MFFFGVSVLAGILTVLAPCILPLLPVVVGSSEPGARRISRRALRVIGSLVVSVIIFTLLLKATTLFIAIPSYAWAWFSGTVLALLGITMVFPELWAKVSLVQKIAQSGNKTLGSGYTRGDTVGDLLMGFALGPVFSTCSPTYLFIIATVLPVSFLVGLIYLLGFALGLAISLLLIAYFGQRIIDLVLSRMNTTHNVKRIFGILLIILGIAIVTGLDKKFESTILDSGYGATIDLEEKLIERFSPKTNDESSSDEISPTARTVINELPRGLVSSFSQTDWTHVDPKLTKALSGGPEKDGIPALTDPVFESIQDFARSGGIQSIVLKVGDEVKVYPYHILMWHEIINDTIGGVPVAVTFCPLCGSAIVYDRRIGTESPTFGVSGFLLESNMIMYDRSTESLWQQSTGKTLAGKHFGHELTVYPMQLMTIAEATRLYPRARVVSEKTGYTRAYGRNPYVGYEESDTFFFPVSEQGTTLHPKTILVVTKVPEETVALVWDTIPEGRSIVDIDGAQLTISRTGSELAITNEGGTSFSFYFEMSFSYLAQHGKDARIIQI
jgi:cytochrome c biogenesis protein CcdA